MINLVRKISRFLLKSKEEKFNDGYNWAKEVIISTDIMEEIEADVEGSSDPFDKGVIKAIREFITDNNLNSMTTMKHEV